MPRVAGADQTQYAKTNKFFDKLFITENIDAILNRNRAGEQGGKGIAMKSDAKTQKQHVLGGMKLAFEPMGQHPLRDIDDKTATRRKALRAKPSTWPGKVLSFELWAEATSYDPTVKDGGVKFQRMLQFLLVRDPGSGQVELNDDMYYSVEAKKHRGPGWYEPMPTSKFEGTPHSLGLNKDAYDQRSWHTPETQGALNNAKHLRKATGGNQGARSNTDDGYHKNPPLLPSTKLVIGSPYEVGSKLNWMLHCLGLLQSKEAKNQGGKRGSNEQFVTTGRKDNCSEYIGACTATGNILAAVIGLYYYPGCNKPENNWVVQQTRGEATYDIRMRMWNPRYALTPNKELLVREPLSKDWQLSLAKDAARHTFVGSHQIGTENEMAPGFLLPHIYRSDSKFAVTTPNAFTPPQPLKTLVQYNERAQGLPLSSLTLVVGVPYGERADKTYPITTDGKKDVRDMMLYLHERLGDVVHKPGPKKDDLRFGFRIPKAHWLYPHWGDATKLTLSKSLDVVSTHKSKGTGFQPLPGWAKNKPWLATQGDHMLRNNSTALKSSIEAYGFAISLMDIEVVSTPGRVPKFRLPQINSIEYALEEGYEPGKVDDLPLDAPKGEAKAAPKGKAKAPPKGKAKADPVSEDSESEYSESGDEEDEEGSGDEEEAADEAPGMLDEDEPVNPAPGEQGDGGERSDTGLPNLGHDEEDDTTPAGEAPARGDQDGGDEGMSLLSRNAILAEVQGFYDPVPGDEDATDELLNKGAVKVDLENGAAFRPDIDFNDHFVSSSVQAWPHCDIYTTDVIDIDTEGLNESQLREYEDTYGSTANAYLRGEAAPQRIKGIFQKYGDALPIIHTKISDNTDVHRRNMCRIVAIYMDTSDFGAKRASVPGQKHVGFEEKRRGMAYGVYAKTKRLGAESVHNEVYYGWENKNAFIPPAKEKTGEWQTLWKPVFGKKKGGAANVPSIDKLKISTLNVRAGLDADTICGEAAFTKWFRTLNSEMTVQGWVTTPWHYQTLPYQKKRILFEDGETYSEGCKRCSRPFYEYKEKYSWFLRGPEGTAHFPNSYWCASEAGQVTCNKALAPKPFHHPAFWKTPTGTAVTVRDEDTVLSRRFSGPLLPGTRSVRHASGSSDGWHGWPLGAFQLGKDPVTKKMNAILACEYHMRTAKTYKGKSMLPLAVNQLPFNQGKPLLYKIYTNHAWRKDRLEFWQGAYPMCVQSRPSTKIAKLQLGMRDYCLQRASKYGNICHDCATVLELAPGLLIRNYRKQTLRFDTGNFNEKMQPGDTAKGPHGNTYWTSLLSRYEEQRRGGLATDDLRVDQMVNFDLVGLHAGYVRGNTYDTVKHGPHRRWKRIFKSIEKTDKSMETYAKMIESHHNLNLGVDSDGRPLTKYNQPPEIYIQKQLDLKSGVFGQVDHAQIKLAVEALVAMRPRSEDVIVNGKVTDVKVTMPKFWTDETPAGAIERKRVFAMPALQHMIFELERRYMHVSQFARDKQTKVFDSDMTRLECRNEQRQHENVTYKNCLVVKQYVPPKMTKGRPVAQDFSETVYYYDHASKSSPEIGTNAETMWRGDQYAADEIAQGGNRKTTQYRKMRQSRLFITYSLHRATTSENEARFLMMRMADAAHELFGNDQNLSELLVFGYKLSAGGKGKEDSISQGGFVPITAPNKADQQPHFFGGANGSSYQFDTYQTHVDKVDLDGGIEVGPQRHHPHFHMLLTINHWSYIQIDYFKMNAYLEMMFKGIDPLRKGWGERFQLIDSSGNLFYTDNENPYVDIKLYPQDNWNDIIAAYVRKNAVPGPMEAQRVARDQI